MEGSERLHNSKLLVESEDTLISFEPRELSYLRYENSALLVRVRRYFHSAVEGYRILDCATLTAESGSK